MSRKREQQRDQRKELARQLGVKGGHVPDALLQNERVTEPAWQLTLAPLSSSPVSTTASWLERARRAARALLSSSSSSSSSSLSSSLSSQPESAQQHVHVALFVVDVAGARCVARTTHRVRATAAAALQHEVVDEHVDDVVRYRRPGHFVVVAAASVGTTDAARALGVALADPARVTLTLDGQRDVAVDDAVLAQRAPASATLRLTGAGRSVDDIAVVAAAVCGVAVVHRVKDTFALPLASADGACALAANLALRL